MNELKTFCNSVEHLSYNTQKNYYIQYNRLTLLLDNEDIHDIQQRKLIELSQRKQSLNSRQAILNIAILVKRLYNLNTTLLEEERDVNKAKLKEAAQSKVKQAGKAKLKEADVKTT